MRLHDFVRRQQHGLLQHVAQFAHIARPAITEHQVLSLGRKAQVWLAITAAMVGKEMPRQ